MVAETNGGQTYERARQDIYLQESGVNPASIILTGNLTGEIGSIWVYAESENHYAMMKPFAQIQNGKSINDASYRVFRNAQTDRTTLCTGESWLSGSKGENPTFVYWTGGFDVMFKKTDSYGKALAGAEFSVYTDAECKNPYTMSGTAVKSVSADGSSKYTDSTGNILEKGTVYFEKLQAGIYYMKETQTPVKDPEGNEMSYVNNNTYVVLVGDGAFTQAGTTGVLADITPEDIRKQRVTATETKDYAVFQIVDGKAVSVPDINTYGIVNVPEKTKRVILRKTDDAFNSLRNAVIVLHRCDMSVIDTLVSNENGIFFTGKLPYGTYYLHETEVPDDVAKNGTDGWWYTLTVTADGCEITEQRKQP